MSPTQWKAFVFLTCAITTALVVFVLILNYWMWFVGALALLFIVRGYAFELAKTAYAAYSEACKAIVLRKDI